MVDAASGERERVEIFVVSDGTGTTVTGAVRAAMLQFDAPWRLRTFAEIRNESQLPRVIEQAEKAAALIVFSLVNHRLARILETRSAERGIPTVDLLGPLIARVASHLREEPRHRPGLLHGVSDDYFRRVEAVEFAVRHDDGANLHTLFRADVVLTGVSRTSKTPLSMYLAQRGYKTGNVPLIPDLGPPRELLDLDPRKVFGLLMDPTTLVSVRRTRMRSVGGAPYANYASPDAIADELEHARRLFRERGWRSVDITGRAVEEAATRILELVEA